MNKYIKKIEKLRNERGWTNNRLSVEAEIGSATVINWFARNATPKLEAIEAVSKAFGITLSNFFCEENEPYSLSDIQKDFLLEFDCLNTDEKNGLMQFLKSLNATRRKFQ